MTLNDMKIRSRLAIGFGGTLVLLVIIIGLGIRSMNSIKQDLDSIAIDHWQKISAANDIRAKTDVIAVSLREMMLVNSMEDSNKQKEIILQSRQHIGENIDRLTRLIALPKGMELLQAIKAQRVAYIQGQNDLIALVEAGKDTEARAYMTAQLRPVLSAYQVAVQELIDFQVELMSAATQDAAATYILARNTLIGLGLGALALAGLLGTLITRSLLLELGGEPRDAAALAGFVAQGDFTHQIALRGNDSTSLLAQLSAMQKHLTTLVANVRLSATTITTAAGEIASGNGDLSSRTEEQASSLEETASSMEELTSTVNQNAENARQANQLAIGASEIAARGGEVVREVVGTMSGISQASKKIADIISVIDGIAFQTNILALNAAVEAARAGEQGRGFAVVASEVRNLAQKSAAAAKEITTLISDSVERVEAGSRLVDQAGTTMEEIVTAVRRVTDIMGEITAASQEQSSGIGQINQAVTQMDQVTQQNAALVEEVAAAAESLNDEAQNLATLISVFKLSADTDLAPPVREPARKISAPPAARAATAERRGPNRATNVSRLSAANTQKAPAAGGVKATGTDGEWVEF